MATPVGDSYSAASGVAIYGGRVAPPTGLPVGAFDSITSFAGSSAIPYSVHVGTPMIISLHGSGGQNYTTGRQYRAQCSGSLAFADDGYTEFGFSLVAVDPNPQQGGVIAVQLRDIDEYGTYPGGGGGSRRESMHQGFKRRDGYVHLIHERRLDGEIAWGKANLSMYDWSRCVCTGGSMGGWATISYALRRPDVFCAAYADRPRWRYGYVAGQIPVANWDNVNEGTPVGSGLRLAPEDGGGDYAQYRDMIAYVLDTSKRIPWVGACLGRKDTYALFSDFMDALTALETAKRGFAAYWNNGDHDTSGPQLSKIFASYPVGTFQLGVGYPLYTSHSRDQDPAIHKCGGKNLDLKHRKVVETATGWSCEITSITPSSSAGVVVAGSTATVIQLPGTESEITDTYAGGTLTIGGETRTVTAYDGTDPAYSTGAAALPKLVTVSAPFSVAPAAGSAYTITRVASCTVMVEPVSSVFTKSVAKQFVTIPSANTWVSVSFT